MDNLKNLCLGRCTETQIALALVLTCTSVHAAGDDWYPASITLPQGYSYPCALTALPHALPGIPPSDQKYINHIYAMILKCIQAKVMIWGSLNNKNTIDAAYAHYYAETKAAADKIRAEPIPKGLETFQNQILTAIALQMTFFSKAQNMVKTGRTFDEIMALPEGRQASAQLQSAWSATMQRYPGLPSEMQNSIYHHLCALDLF